MENKSMTEVRRLLDQWWSELRDKTRLRQVGEWIEITTPYLDRHNDCIQIYATRRGDGFLLSDDGSIVTDLMDSGRNLDSATLHALQMVGAWEVQVRGRNLEVRATADNFALRMHNLVQAMLAVNGCMVCRQ